MNKVFKRVLIGFATIVLLVVLAAVIIAGFFQEAVGKRLITEINKQLTTELTVGDFELSLLKGFPDATASLHNVAVKGQFGSMLLEAKDMSFRFRLLSLFGQQVKVHSISIKDGALNVHIDKRGNANYHIFKSDETSSEEDFSIALSEAKLNQVELVYRDEKLQHELLQKVEEAVFSGELSNTRYDLVSTAKLSSYFVDLKGVRYFAGKKWGYDANVFVDLDQGQYDFKKVKVLVEDNTFSLSGAIQKEKSYTNFDLIATADQANLESVIALLPEKQLEVFGDFTSRGKFHFSMDILGKLSPTQSPDIEATFSIENGRLEHPKLREPFKEVSFEANYTNGEMNSLATSSFEIKDFKGYLHRELLTMYLKVDDFDDPFIDFQADGAMPLGYLYDFFQHPGITDGDGDIEIKNLDVSGLYSDMLSISHILDVHMSGEIDFDDATLKINGDKITIDKGKLLFSNNHLSLQDLEVEGAGNDFRFQGNVWNLLPVLFADSLNTHDAKLKFDGEMYASKLDLFKLRKMADVPVEEGSVQKEVYDSLHVEKYIRRERLTDLLQGTFQAKVDAFSYNKIEGRDFSGQLAFADSKMQVIGTASGMDGQFALDGTIFFEKEPYIEAKLSGDKVDVKEFFYQTENAGQDFIRHEHLSGTMNAKMLIHAHWDSTGNFQSDKLHVWAGLGVQDGALKGFGILDEFSTYAKVSDLRNVQFEDMQNWLEIKDRKFYLPVMFIQNNAMNMSICGEQTFDDKIDYSIKVNAGQVIANKFKSGSNQKPIKAKKDGFFNMYFNVYGTLEKYEYETNKRKVKDMFAKSEKQKQQIRAVLIRHFGAPLNMLREPAEWLDDGEVADWKDDDDVEYIEGF